MSTPAQPAAEPTGAAPAVPTPADVAALHQPAPAPAPVTPDAAPAAAGGTGGEEPKDWEAEAAKWKALARQHEGKHLSALGLKSKSELDDLRAAAQKWADAEDAQKTEIQRATEQAQTVQKQLEQERAQNARLLAAAAHGIPPELIDLLGAGSAEEINARAEALASQLKPAAAPAARPVESLTPGATPASNGGDATPDQWIRRLAGRNATP
ncbi:hypothetical protein HHL19_16620 [Streptomyces sp. R302]|uniref:hypothetical protein n=1 Tax=unclassified Streptomyces TaxID=2593676 RepID=UPI00145E5225|nr:MULTISPECIES: hypothetical protein [unclassified Streptomyces]NML55394.1 hypothetical protein [Streptomyces sp. R301]NML80266.1 hypothetical protein [Streptomyces sp. R302]